MNEVVRRDGKAKGNDAGAIWKNMCAKGKERGPGRGGQDENESFETKPKSVQRERKSKTVDV